LKGVIFLQLRTDLAIEAKEMYSADNVQSGEPDGVVSCAEQRDNALITTVEIKNKSGEEKLNKPIGKYITIESRSLRILDPETTKKFSYLVKEQLLKVIGQDETGTVLVVGLGNWNITPDALGPKVASEIMVTRHITEYAPGLIGEDLRPVCAVSPGVMGITGVETLDLVSGIVKKVKPALVIAIDALASKNPERISTTVQITDTGITPGSGVGNKREGLNLRTLGVPVISVGVPTVVDAVSIAAEMMNKMYDNIIASSKGEGEIGRVVSKLKQSFGDELIRQVTDGENQNLLVTPKEVDNIISHISKVISNGINLALQPDVDLEYIESFVY